MPKVTYIEFDGTEHTVDANANISVMEAAVSNSIPGIDGDCGGGAACGTCHVYVDPKWIEKTGVAEDVTETSMLQFAEEVHDNSRLSCQITLSDELDGLIVRMPAAQY